ncbi:hypothetical protein [Chondromyces crocatus]|nr:hypothetical protein [Chondromyces crocatus]
MRRAFLRSMSFAATLGLLTALGGTALAQTLAPGQSLERGNSVRSSNGRYTFVMQDDGNLVLYAPGSRALWATGTDGQAIRNAIMQQDGNLVLYDYANRPKWASNTNGQSGAYLVVQDDGNVVIYRPRVPIWASNTNQNSPQCNTPGILEPGQSLRRGAQVQTGNGTYRLVMQDDGNLVVYRRNGSAVWATGTNGVSIREAIMQQDGNLVLYDYASRARWASGTNGNPGSTLEMQCDGNLVIYKPNAAIWATNTVQR